MRFITDLFDVGGAKTGLHRDDATARRFFGTKIVAFELLHAGGGKKHRRVGGDQRRMGHQPVPLFHKELNKKFESKRIESLKLWIKESDEKKVKKETKKSGQVDDAKDKLKKVQSEKQDIIMKQVYTLKTENPDMSWRDIAKQINITHPSAKKYYNLYKSIIDNQTNLPRLDKDNKNPLYKLG